ncbi:MAG: hypothetical protein BGO69_02960 [Bacteroidetes bacterium 46-16]|nr:MAG: hypothetical protein BGO69_02960 [Bacteroidetes bacterium 46-16]
MLHRTLVATAVLALTGNCIYAQTPMQYNNKLVAITDSLHAKGSRWVQVFKEVKMIKEFSLLEPYRSDLQDYINDEITELKADKDVSGSAELKQAVLDFLAYEKSFVQQCFKPVEELDESSADEELKAAIDKISEEARKEDALLMKVNKAQEAYARRNNFDIEAPNRK